MSLIFKDASSVQQRLLVYRGDQLIAEIRESILGDGGECTRTEITQLGEPGWELRLYQLHAVLDGTVEIATLKGFTKTLAQAREFLEENYA